MICRSKLLYPMSMAPRSQLLRLVRISVLAALAAALMTLQFPLLPGAPYLKYDPSEIAVYIGAFALGPLDGIAIAALKDVLFVLAHPGAEAFVGAPMNFLAVASFAWVAATFYWQRKTRTRAVVALTMGTIASAALMVPANLIILPWFIGPVSSSLVIATVTPFNLLRGGINGVLVFLVYKKVSPWLKTSSAPSPLPLPPCRSHQSPLG